MKAHQALLDAQQDIKAAFFSVADPIGLFGLPTSGVTDTLGPWTLSNSSH